MSLSRNRKEWRLPVHGDWVVVRARDAAEDEERYPLALRAAQLRVWTRNVFHSRVLLEIAGTLWGGVGQGRAQADRWNTLLPRLEDAFRLRTLVLVRRRHTASAGGAGGGAASAAAELLERQRAESASAAGRSAGSGSGGPPRKPKTWVAIRLMDQDGQPIADEAYKLVLPDGTVQEGSLDESGEVFVNSIDPGECQISFPKLDGKEWKPA